MQLPWQVFEVFTSMKQFNIRNYKSIYSQVSCFAYVYYIVHQHYVLVLVLVHSWHNLLFSIFRYIITENDTKHFPKTSSASTNAKTSHKLLQTPTICTQSDYDIFQQIRLILCHIRNQWINIIDLPKHVLKYRLR